MATSGLSPAGSRAAILPLNLPGTGGNTRSTDTAGLGATSRYGNRMLGSVIDLLCSSLLCQVIDFLLLKNEEPIDLVSPLTPGRQYNFSDSLRSV